MIARLFALGVGVLGLAALRAQYDALLPPVSGQDLPDQLWFLAGFFTILTNLLVTFHMLAVARGWTISASRAAGLVVAMVMVAIVYHAVLARQWQPVGLAWWADQGLHTAMPLATLLWWLLFAPKAIGWRDLPHWLIWPAGYAIYALIRGQMTGFFPYPFLDATVLGWPQVALSVAALLAGFTALGAGLIGVARRLG